MNVILHGWPGDLEAKRMHQINSYNDNIIVRATAFKDLQATDLHLIYRFAYHDGKYYHYKLVEPEFI